MSLILLSHSRFLLEGDVGTYVLVGNIVDLVFLDFKKVTSDFAVKRPELSFTAKTVAGS